MKEVFHIPQSCAQDVSWRMKGIRNPVQFKCLFSYTFFYIVLFYIITSTLLWYSIWPIHSKHSNQRHSLEERPKYPHVDFDFWCWMPAKLQIWEGTNHWNDWCWLVCFLRISCECLEGLEYPGLYNVLPIWWVHMKMRFGGILLMGYRGCIPQYQHTTHWPRHAKQLLLESNRSSEPHWGELLVLIMTLRFTELIGMYKSHSMCIYKLTNVFHYAKV